MVVLGVSGRRQNASAALAVDGTLVAAACESSLIGRDAGGYRVNGPPPAATAACLRKAGLRASDITQVVVADDRVWTCDQADLNASPWSGSSAVRAPAPAYAGRRGDHGDHDVLAGLRDRPVVRVGSGFAAAVQAVLSTSDPCAPVVVLDRKGRGEAVTYRRAGRRLQPARVVAGFSTVVASAGQICETLGLGRHDVQGLALLGHGESPIWEEQFRRAWNFNGEGTCASEWIDAAICEARSDAPGELDAAASPHVVVQQRRRRLAASCSHVLAALVADLLECTRRDAGARTVAAAGDLFGSAAFNTRLRAALGETLSIAPVPESVGLALGAALVPAFRAGRASCIDHATGLGPEPSDAEVKHALENCRLDYLYEPDWQRLLARVSTLLERGRAVAWYQGALDFGPRSAGNRSVLCDPSSRYVRDNINHFLLHRSVEHPLAVAMTREAAAECIEEPLIPPFTLQYATVREGAAEKFSGILDRTRVCPIDVVDRRQAPELCDLLDLHARRTGVAGLVHITLGDDGDLVAATPRAAIRAVFSSAIDALVIRRFLLMKDYWLLRSDEGPL